VTSYQYNSISYILVSMRGFYCFGANKNNNFGTICGTISVNVVLSDILMRIRGNTTMQDQSQERYDEV
jgi:hypothetical protein